MHFVHKNLFFNNNYIKRAHNQSHVLSNPDSIRLKFVTDTDTQTTAVQVIPECGFLAVESYTQRRAEINRELHREPEIVLDTDTAGCSYKTVVELESGLYGTTDTHVPVPLTLLFPGYGSVERVNPVIRTSCLQTIETRYTDFQLNHVRLT